MSYINSGNINIFPAARSGDYPNAYRLSEQTITELIRSLLSNQDGFVIGNHDWDSASEPTTFSFILGGYLISFNTQYLPAFDNSKKLLWACIHLSGSGEDNLLSLDGFENAGKNLDIKTGETTFTFYGVDFVYSDSKPADVTYALPILEKAGNTWRIPENSKLQFTTSANTRAIKIDDGDLTNYDN